MLHIVLSIGSIHLVMLVNSVIVIIVINHGCSSIHCFSLPSNLCIVRKKSIHCPKTEWLQYFEELACGSSETVVSDELSVRVVAFTLHNKYLKATNVSSWLFAERITGFTSVEKLLVNKLTVFLLK